MKIVFNELSTSYVAPDIETAHKWLDLFFEIAKQCSIRRGQTVSIVTTYFFGEIYFHQETSFTNWIKTIKDRDFKRLILSMITKHPLLDYPYFLFKGKQCQGFGIAFQNDEISLSYGPENWPDNEIIITREQFASDEDVELQELCVRHISSLDHLDFHCPVRIFKHNPKHDRIRPIANKDEKVSILECSLIKASKLLKSSISEFKVDGRKLYNFDIENGKFIIFYCHKQGEFHGFHTDNENDIPNTVRLALKGK